jgi:hypothetical protein
MRNIQKEIKLNHTYFFKAIICFVFMGPMYDELKHSARIIFLNRMRLVDVGFIDRSLERSAYEDAHFLLDSRLIDEGVILEGMDIVRKNYLNSLIQTYSSNPDLCPDHALFPEILGEAINSGDVSESDLRGIHFDEGSPRKFANDYCSCTRDSILSNLKNLFLGKRNGDFSVGESTPIEDCHSCFL